MTILIDPSLPINATTDDLTAVFTTGHRHDCFADEITGQAWRPIGNGDLPWSTWAHPGTPYRIHIARRWELAGDPMIGSKQATVPNLAAWVDATGVHYRMTPGVAATEAILAEPRKRRPQWRLIDWRTTEAWKPPVQTVDFDWPAKPPRGPLHRWDMRSAYLAAAAAVDLPWGKLARSGTLPTHRAAGFYRIRAPFLPSNIAALLPRKDRQDCRWVTHPLYEWLRWEYENGLEVVDSYTADNQGQGRILRSWAERWRDAIHTHPDIAPQLKAGYAQAIGLMNVPKGRLYRPDWRAMIIDQVKASLLRRIVTVDNTADVWPARVKHDSVWYAEEVWPEAVAAGNHIGQMRYEGIENG